MVDTSLLEPGIPDYNRLNRTYIIMIMPFDLFGYGRYKYTFEAQCREEPECSLEDGAVRIFLNTRGKNDTEVSEELIAFLHYVENTTEESAGKTESERIHRIHDRVCKVKFSEEMGVKYMQAWEERYYDQQDARREGLAEGERNKLKALIRKKLQKGKTIEEIADALEETEENIYKLMEEIQQEE